VVDMGDDGDIAYRLGHESWVSFTLIRPRRPCGWGIKMRCMAAQRG